MKITTTAGQLADLLGRVARAVATRSTIPVLQGVLFRAHEGEGGSPGSLAMAATDTEISLTLNASAPVEEAGAAVIPAKILLRYARSLSKGAGVTLQASEAERTATLSSGKSSVTLRCFPDEDFPAPAPTGTTTPGALFADGHSVEYVPLTDDERHVVVGEIHSHHVMEPLFSRTDDRSERRLGVYGVIGHKGRDRPTALFRFPCGTLPSGRTRFLPLRAESLFSPAAQVWSIVEQPPR